MKTISVVILGGGRGRRLFPLTFERAKPAVSFAGKYRLIDIPLSNCINSGIKRISVLTQFLSASLHRHIMQTYHFDMFTDGFVDLLAAEQTLHHENWFQGTADAVRATRRHTTYYKYDDMLILSGDHLYRMNYADLIRYHRIHKADISISVYPCTKAEAPEYGLLKVDDCGIVNEFVEKPNDEHVIDQFLAPDQLFDKVGHAIDGQRYLASMGIYLFTGNALNEVLKDKTKTDCGKDIIAAAINKFKVMAYPFTGYWQDIGTIRSYFNANLSLVSQNPSFHLYEPNWPIYTRERSLPPSRVIRSEIRDSLLVEGSEIVGAKIGESIIGMRAKVNEGTELNKVLMLGADFYEGEQVLTKQLNYKQENLPLMGIGRNCTINRAIIDKNARIGDNVAIEVNSDIVDYQGENYWIKDGITIIPKGAVIPSNTIISF